MKRSKHSESRVSCREERIDPLVGRRLEGARIQRPASASKLLSISHHHANRSLRAFRLRNGVGGSPIHTLQGVMFERTAAKRGGRSDHGCLCGAWSSWTRPASDCAATFLKAPFGNLSIRGGLGVAGAANLLSGCRCGWPIIHPMKERAVEVWSRARHSPRMHGNNTDESDSGKTRPDGGYTCARGFLACS